MSKTQNQLLAEARQRLDESAAHAWDDEWLRVLINDGAKDIARRTESMQKKGTIAAVAGTRSYTMPTDMVRAHRIEYFATGVTQIHTLEGRDYNNADAIWGLSQAVTSGTPSIYALWGYPPTLLLYLYPTPAVSGTINVYYYKLPTSLATATTTSGAVAVDIPEGWEDLILDYVEYRALRRDRDPAWQSAKAIYDEHLLDMYDTTRRWTDQAGVITGGGAMGLPAWLVDSDW